MSLGDWVKEGHDKKMLKIEQLEQENKQLKELLRFACADLVSWQENFGHHITSEFLNKPEIKELIT
jgi:hypothetical protein